LRLRERFQGWRALIAPRSALPLALLRIGVSIIVLLSPEPSLTLGLASGPQALLLPPSGLSALPAILQLLSPILDELRWLLLGAAVLSLVGLWTRASVLLLTFGVALFFGGAQLTGTVIHNMHLLWMLAILAIAPSGDALSIDAWRAGRPLLGGEATVHAGVAVIFARMLLGLVYLFPGIDKLRVSGLAWAFSDNLSNQMRFKWFMAGGVEPWPRLDHVPALVEALALLALGFELSFLGLCLFRRTRPWAIASGLAFHGAIQYFMYIPFSSLWACYGILVDGRVSRTASRRVGTWVWTTAGLGACIVVGVTVQGARAQTQSWPFACYPTFSSLAPAAIVDLAVEVRTDSELRTLRRPRTRPSHEWGTIWRLLGLYGGGVDRPRLRALATEWLRQQGAPTAVQQVTLYAEVYSTDPARRSAPPLRRTWIDEF
jgi:hypothetical protein